MKVGKEISLNILFMYLYFLLPCESCLEITIKPLSECDKFSIQDTTYKITYSSNYDGFCKAALVKASGSSKNNFDLIGPFLLNHSNF